MLRTSIVVLFTIHSLSLFSQGFEVAREQRTLFLMAQDAQLATLPDAPSTMLDESTSRGSDETPFYSPAKFETDLDQSRGGTPQSPNGEPYHWKGLLLQSFAFDMLQNATRVITADQSDRHILLNKPFWSEY